MLGSTGTQNSQVLKALIMCASTNQVPCFLMCIVLKYRKVRDWLSGTHDITENKGYTHFAVVIKDFYFTLQSISLQLYKLIFTKSGYSVGKKNQSYQ